MDGARRLWSWLAAALIAALLWLAAGQRPRERRVLAALDAAQAAALCSVAGYPLSDFWERVQVMGVRAALFREETLTDLSARGEFLALPASKPNALWLRDERLLGRILAAAERKGVSASTATMAGYPVVEFPGGANPAFGVGYDEASVSLVESKKLAALLEGAESRQEGWSRSVLDVTSSRSALLRAAYSHPRRLILFSFDTTRGLEENLSLLRSALKLLRERGVDFESLEAAAEAFAAPTPASWRLWLAWLFSILGPLLAVRAGLQCFKKIRPATMQRWPAGSPALEIGAGYLCAVVISLVMGLIVFLTLGPGGEAGLTEGLASSALAAPLVIGLAALYPLEAAHWKKRLGAALTLGGVARNFLILLVVLSLFQPRLILSALGIEPWVLRVEESCRWLWWWRWRWREILFGLPSLLYAFFLLERRSACPDCPGGDTSETRRDPRRWLLLGLVGPCGIIAAVGSGVSLAMALSQTAIAVVLGALIGAAAIALRWSIRPRAS